MAAGHCLLLLCVAAGVVLQVRAQTDSKGFITIDCGLTGETGYAGVGDTTVLPDNGEFTDNAGTCHNISAEYVTRSTAKSWYSVRSFPAGMRNCYTLGSLVSGLKYIVRARFMYGNYDGLDSPPVFDLYIGVNYWQTVKISSPGVAMFVEAIVMVPDDFVQVCLVNTGTGRPFISGLDLRPMKGTLYPQVTAAQGLALLDRINFGPIDYYTFVRYPDDPHDRIWFPSVDTKTWSSISTTQEVQNIADDLFQVPSAVLQTAIMPRNASQNIELAWTSGSTPNNKAQMDPSPTPEYVLIQGRPSPEYIVECTVILHFAELKILPENAVRRLNVILNDKPWHPDGFRPQYLTSSVTYNRLPLQYSHYNLTVEASGNATLPPIINAAEIFSVFNITNLGTDSQDVSAITAIKGKYQVKKNWMGDPCVPKTMAWDRLTCSNGVIGSRPRVTSVRQFTYKELEKITTHFQRVLGRGGFGYVYDGSLEDGTQVAVKLRSDSSNQGVKEFLAEARILTRIHHTNLVSMIGYCKDGEYMALVYEYMSEGTLQEHIDGSNRSGACLPWKERLRIALESAQGLEYLHKGCKPPIIHRDVKATNILLNAELEASIADFGLSKAFNSNDTHVFTNTVVGTPGYVDPEYQTTMQLTTKSDVYSFGVVLLELVTGKPAILHDPMPVNIIQWVRQRLAQGNIEAVVDARMCGQYDVNTVWKIADIALKCTALSSVQRPSMTDVVAQLRECIELENGHSPDDASNDFYAGGNYPNMSNNSYTTHPSTNVSQKNTSSETEKSLMRVPTIPTGPATR
ncbi:hypothetical protein QYE76_000257 [Lolium multiflorum]|uniref:Protein kinase domain-containing protein n=1 Tax=Lolium multiflorum TaxID=4521 RepID=A0AAD8RJW8_LOLMU|nr:hypothetical protein QYE76_000257 [Lolium multiflorum]